MSSAPFVISRVLDAPQALVWEVYTEPSHLAQWFGPKGSRNTHGDMDFRVGGRYHYALEFMGAPLWGLWEFVDIAAPDRLSALQCFSDAEGGATRHPLAPLWPLRTLSTTTLSTPDENRTLLALSCLPHEATPVEEALFAASHASLTAGWSGTFDMLEAYLTTLAGPAAPSA